MGWQENQMFGGAASGAAAGFGYGGPVGAAVGGSLGFITGMFSKKPKSVDELFPKINAGAETEQYMMRNPFESRERQTLADEVASANRVGVEGAVSGGASMESASRLATLRGRSAFVKGNEAITREVGNIKTQVFGKYLDQQRQREVQRAAYQIGQQQESSLIEDAIPLVANAFAQRAANKQQEALLAKLFPSDSVTGTNTGTASGGVMSDEERAAWLATGGSRTTHSAIAGRNTTGWW